jgi:hypothetical protein
MTRVGGAEDEAECIASRKDTCDADDKVCAGVGMVLALTSPIVRAQDLPSIEKTQKTMRLAR